MISVRLDEKQLHELELLLAGAYGEDHFYRLPTASPVIIPTLRLNSETTLGDSVGLVDTEGTVLASLKVEGSQLTETGVWVSGPVTALRSFGHLTLAERRVTRAQDIVGPVVLLIGEPPPVGDSKWSGLEVQTVLIVVDDGNPVATAERFASIPVELKSSALIVPAPAAEHLSASDHTGLLRGLLANLLAVDISVMHGNTRAGTGLVILFSGLSGSGKSTIAKELADRLRLTDARRTTLLDGDEVRAMLSSELGFDRAARELNVRRIGWVAATVAEHGGIAICAPIAPYESMRAEVRNMAQAHGRFVLVHVATPLEVCEARDRKGLYARARRGEIPQFTGVSDPYEIPVDADVVINTSTMGVESCVDIVMAEIAKS